MSYVWVLLAFLVMIGWLGYRHRIQRAIGRRSTPLDDEQIRQIEETGRVEVDDDPLDLDEIERAEDEFWEESWDEPEPW